MHDGSAHAGPAKNVGLGGERLGIWVRSVDTMTIAGEFYLIAHDDRTGKPRLHQRAVAVGVAAGLLAELLYLSRVHVAGTELWLLPGDPPPDPLNRATCGLLRAEKHPTRVWLEVLATTSIMDVTCRLEREGVLAPRVSRRMFRVVTTWLPTDPNVGAMSWARLSVLLRRQAPLSPLDVALAGLVSATGLDAVVLDGAPRAARAYLSTIVDNLWPPLRDLLAGARAVIGADVLSHRM